MSFNFIKPASNNAWRWGLGGGTAWLQFGDYSTSQMVLTVQRSLVHESVSFILNDASAAVTPSHEVPGYMDFSLEAGYETGVEEQVMALEGVGLVQELESGGVGLFAGNLDVPSAAQTKLIHQVVQASKGGLRFYAAETCYELPLPSDARNAFEILSASHKEFNERAVVLFKL